MGTNTIERIAINYALLSDFAKSDHIILASTHDNEITTLLQDKYDLYYFSETVADTQLEFDYKLKKGVDREGNAIKSKFPILGYPLLDGRQQAPVKKKSPQI